jgi:predicted regulator of Ras-like GTPase activity (Roadblock/LC7/MglB family)
MTVTSDIDERIAKCQKILDGDPNSQIFAALAEAYRKSGDLDKAFRTCQSGLRVHPSYGLAHVVMAKINLDRGMYDWAEVEVNKAVELEGASRATELLLAEIHIYKGEFHAAIRLLKKLHQTDPNNAQIAKLLSIAKRIPEEQSTLMSSRSPSAVAPGGADVSEIEPDDHAVTSIAEVLAQSLAVDHSQSSMFINNEGMVVESDWHGSMDREICGAVMAEVCNAVMQELARTPFGQAGTVLIESENHVFLVLKLQEGMFVFVADAGVNLGSLKMKVTALVDEYRTSKSGS